MNKMMKIFITIFVLLLLCKSWTKADDISDFEIEGVLVLEIVCLNFDSKKYLTKKN